LPACGVICGMEIAPVKVSVGLGEPAAKPVAVRVLAGV
jgi:hypothetical protein